MTSPSGTIPFCLTSGMMPVHCTRRGSPGRSLFRALAHQPGCEQPARVCSTRRVTARAGKRYPRHNEHVRAGVTAFATAVVLLSRLSALSALPDGGQSSPQPVAPGFHMEGQPQLEIPFGDADAYRKTVDRFLALHDQMQELRDDFSRSVQDVLQRVSTSTDDKKRK